MPELSHASVNRGKKRRENQTLKTNPPAGDGLAPALYPMKKLALIISAIIICSTLVACRIDATALLSSEDNLALYIHSGGTSVTKREIVKNSETYNELRDWLTKNEKGWSSSPATYVPSIEVRGKKFTLNFLQGSVILNFQDANGRYHQYVKDVKLEEYQFLNK